MPELKTILASLDHVSIVRLKNSAKKAASLEAKWRQKLQDEIWRQDRKVAEHIVRNGELPPLTQVDFTDLMVMHWFDVQKEAIMIAHADSEMHINPKKRLAKRWSAPTSIRELMKLWDLWRKKKIKSPSKQSAMAAAIKAKYLQKVHQFWKEKSEDFREGKEFSQAKVQEGLKKYTGASYSRGKTIIDTETTNYYNRARREVYDGSPDVVAYLFLAIRDSATTKWCKTRQGLVYHRGDRYLDEETPAIHWNCRSEVLPLTRQNPVHLKLIDDSALDRKNNRPEPLPKDFNKK